MDETKELFNKIKMQDRESFHLLTETYGWKLYSHIRRTVSDREAADRIFSETLSRFHSSAKHSGSDDPIEAMLYLYADSLIQSGNSTAAGEIVPPQAWPEPGKEKKQRRKRSFGSVLASVLYGICITVLILGILIALWFLAGILVDMNILPRQWDLGYTWFNEHIAYWF